MVSALDSKVSGLGSSLGQGHCVVFLGKTLYTHSASLHPSTYKWVLANLMLGLPCDGLASHPVGSGNTPSHYATETRISSSLLGHLARMQTACACFV